LPPCRAIRFGKKAVLAFAFRDLVRRFGFRPILPSTDGQAPLPSRGNARPAPKPADSIFERLARLSKPRVSILPHGLAARQGLQIVEMTALAARKIYKI